LHRLARVKTCSSLAPFSIFKKEISPVDFCWFDFYGSRRKPG
jgi:hypothetical protein